MAWRKVIRFGAVLGRSYVLTQVFVCVIVSLGIASGLANGGVVIELVSCAKHGGGLCVVGVISTHHKCALDGSHVPWRTVLPCLSWMRMWCLSRCVMQLASQSLLMLSRLLVNPGMICPVRAWRVGMFGRLSWVDAKDGWDSPMARWMVVHGVI